MEIAILRIEISMDFIVLVDKFQATDYLPHNDTYEERSLPLLDGIYPTQ